MLIIRADMNKHIATGHVMRCLSIADAATKLGYEVRFVVADEEPVNILKTKGYTWHVLGTPWDNMECEVDEFDEYCKKEKVTRKDVILVDSYSATNNYFTKLKKIGAKIWYIDDFHTDTWNVDGIICYEIFYDQIGYFIEDGNTLLGTKYAPIRSEFMNCEKKIIRNKAKNILILSGGTDPYNVIGEVLNRLELERFDSITAVCGLYNERYENLKNKYKDIAHKVHIIRSTDHIIEYMKEADLAISAAGSTLIELGTVGTPTICYSLADNQIINGECFDSKGLMLYAGDVRSDDSFDRIKNLVDEIMRGKEKRSKMSDMLQKCFDGNGAERIVKAIMQ